MKAFTLALFVVVSGIYAHADTRVEGGSALIQNEDEFVLEISGTAAQEMYKRMTVPAVRKDPFNMIKYGRNINCSMNQDETVCQIVPTQGNYGELDGGVE